MTTETIEVRELDVVLLQQSTVYRGATGIDGSLAQVKRVAGDRMLVQFAERGSHWALPLSCVVRVVERSNFNSRDEYDEWEQGRGQLAGTPAVLECVECKCWREVVKLGRVVEARRDPTQTYVLSCEHVAI